MRAIAEGLFTDEPAPRLVGARHRASGRIVFPCPEGSDYEPCALGRQGTLWSYTIQRYRPKSPPYAGPEDFAPWPVAYVELPGETMVEARLTNVAFAEIAIGMPLELTFIPLDPAAADPVMIHAFQPLPASSGACA
ncbi:MAG: Zn-ribbon domain-containing OB-fold protein [Novosphingobium sp.]